MLKISKFFDKLEDRIRASLSRRPVIYSLIGGTAVVLFWQGVSVVAESFPFLNTLAGGVVMVVVSVIILLATGLFVSFFIGDTIIISGINKEKKLVEKEEGELIKDSMVMSEMERKIDEIDNIVKDLQSKTNHGK